jgi:acyl-CoA reductase-like NAD-dependent aldehyde dehydrogenase
MSKVKNKHDAPADMGLQLQRLISLHEPVIQTLESKVHEGANRGEILQGTVRELMELSKSMNDLSLAYARFRKAEDEWAERLSVEERLEHLHNFLLKLNEDRPDLVNGFIRTFLAVYNNADSVKRVAEEYERIEAERRAHQGFDWADDPEQLGLFDKDEA